MAVLNVTLNNGNSMPVLGLGVFPVPDPAECERGVIDAIETGHRRVDLAAPCVDEEPVGKGIEGKGLAREESLITAKLWAQHTGHERIGTASSAQSAWAIYRRTA